ncbi:MAG: formamidopyrimidine-DNA glycosylase [Acidobacteria bacterium]|nr:MAG: formamidopyrimidine-DNA glycosylase [Acidobacteriota bacterium]
MPELPDIIVYQEALSRRVTGMTLEHVRLSSPFLLRTVEPPIASVEGRGVAGVERVGKRLVLALDGDLFLVLHLMIAGRLHWKERGAQPPKKVGLAAFDFTSGTLTLTEAGSKRRAALHLAGSRAALQALDPGGIDVLAASLEEFRARLRSASHTLKRSLTDPRLFSGIGNAYSDEVLHAAQLSPLQLTGNLADDEVSRLYEATRQVLHVWIERLRQEAGDAFPEKVTAFRKDMAVHGRFRQPCPRCGAPVQRIVYAQNEANYCPRCQTGGRLLADRALSRLLREDWPRRLED